MDYVLVTGGAGFIGSHLVALLVEKGVRVRVLDSLVSGKKERVPAVADFVLGDIRDRVALEKAMKGMTHVVHLAAQVSVPASIEDPSYTHDVNVVGTENVLEAAHHAGVKRFVYASSAAVYGDHPELPKTEESPLQPKSPYAESKIANETNALASGLSTIGLRFFNVYGPGQKADHAYASVIPRFIKDAQEGRPLPLTGDGSATRDFVHTTDVARAIFAALESDTSGVCNVASGTATKISDLIEIIRSVVPIEIQELPVRPGDILHSVADISRARKVLGWSPTVKLENGVRELLTL